MVWWEELPIGVQIIVTLPLDADTDEDGLIRVDAPRNTEILGEVHATGYVSTILVHRSDEVDRFTAMRVLDRATLTILGGTIGLFVGVLSAVKRATLFDNIARLFSVLFDALPQFWFGLLLIMFFSVQLGWLPVGGRLPLNKPDITLLDRVRYLAMPSFVLAISWIALMSRFMRAETLEVIRQDYVRTAWAKGLKPSKVYFKHAARNALVPIVTILGPAITSLITGAVVIERIFSWPGMGRLTVDAVSSRDYPIVMGSVIFGALVVILGNLLSDFLLVAVDPRIRLQ